MILDLKLQRAQTIHTASQNYNAESHTLTRGKPESNCLAHYYLLKALAFNNLPWQVVVRKVNLIEPE